jgi:hypothetical protein
MHMLYEVLRECAATSTCWEFVEKGGEWYAVVTEQDIIDYCDSKRIGAFPGKRKVLAAFVRSSDGAVGHIDWKQVAYHRPSNRVGHLVRAFVGGG